MCRAAQSEPGRVQARPQAAYPWSSEGAGEGFATKLRILRRFPP